MPTLVNVPPADHVAHVSALGRRLGDGIMTDLVTPFRWGAVDLHGLKRLVDWQIAAGVTALSPCGLMGEGTALSPEERAQVIHACLDAAKGRVPIIPSTGTNCTETSIALTRHAKALGAEAALITVPFYSKPSQAGILHHVTRLAEAVELPLLIEDRPERTAVALAPETLTSLCQLPGVIGVITASSPARLRPSPESDRALASLSSGEGTYLGAALSGVFGLFSQVANVFPETLVALQDACRASRIDEALCLQDGVLPMLEAFARWGGPAVAKRTLAENLPILDSVRLPQAALSGNDRLKLTAHLSGSLLHAS